jgi:hypothetical protein
MTPNHLPTDIIVTVPDIGTFRFRRRSLGVEMQTKVEYARLTQGQPVEAEVSYFMRHVANLNVMTVEAPVNWPEDLSSMDGLDGDTYEKVMAVGEALLDKEATFRPAGPKGPIPGSGEGGQAGGEGN